MTGRKSCALQLPPVVPYKALGNFPEALYGTTGGSCSARFFRPVMAWSDVTGMNFKIVSSSGNVQDLLLGSITSDVITLNQNLVNCRISCLQITQEPHF